MMLNKFFINILIRVTFIVLSSIVLGIIVQHLSHGYYYTLAGVISLIVFQAYMLVHQVNKTNTDLEKFFSSVQDHDSSVRFLNKSENKAYEILHDKMNALNIHLQNSKIENERTRQFLLRVVHHVDFGLLSFDENGNIGLYNKTAQQYLKIRQSQQFSTLENENSELFKIINTIRPGQEVLHKIEIGNLFQSILIKATELRFESNTVKLVSFQDITNELNKKELDSWQKLIRVLTHEIMNSISPITSLTSVISGYFTNKYTRCSIPPEEVNHQIIEKTLAGLNTIEETGKGLLGFVDNFRSLSSLPIPKLTEFNVDRLFQECKLLMEPTISSNIKISTSVFPENLTIEADYAQMEQVLVNLIKNACEALSNKIHGTIHLKAICNDREVFIIVEDNGTGISSEVIDDIFIPFYTTKANGSGIGLSLSKQIMQNHHGTISVNSEPNKGAQFILKFQI